MTVFEASIKLYEWFGENDSFHLSKDLPALTGKQIKNKEVAAAVLCGLGKLKAMGVIDETAVSNDAVWVLEKNFHTLDQDVKLSLETCQSITHIVTAFCELIGNEAEKPDPANITEQDIKNLIFVCTTLMEKRTETESTEEE